MTNLRPALGSLAVTSILLLAACGGTDDPSAAPEAPEVGVSDGGGAVVEGAGDAMEEEPAGEAPSGSPLGDANREEYLAMGMPPESVESVAWAGDVSTEDGSFVEYPDGLRVSFAGVSEGSAPVSVENGDLDSEKDLVRVTLEVSNGGDVALPINGDYSPFRVYEGENLTEVSSHVGYFGEEDELYSANDESVVAPGSSIEVYQSFEVEPGAALEVELNPDFFGVEHTPFVFYGLTA